METMKSKSKTTIVEYIKALRNFLNNKGRFIFLIDLAIMKKEF